jgi:hypothetical protein
MKNRHLRAAATWLTAEVAHSKRTDAMQITIREVLLFMLLTGIGAAWWGDRQQLWKQIVASHDRGLKLAEEHVRLTGGGIGVPVLPGHNARFDD